MQLSPAEQEKTGAVVFISLAHSIQADARVLLISSTPSVELDIVARESADWRIGQVRLKVVFWSFSRRSVVVCPPRVQCFVADRLGLSKVTARLGPTSGRKTTLEDPDLGKFAGNTAHLVDHLAFGQIRNPRLMRAVNSPL